MTIAQDLGGVVLLPCPFCGGNADTYFGNITKRHYVSCMTENCGMTGPDAHTYESAIAAWNTRANSAEIGTSAPYPSTTTRSALAVAGVHE